MVREANKDDLDEILQYTYIFTKTGFLKIQSIY